MTATALLSLGIPPPPNSLTRPADKPTQAPPPQQQPPDSGPTRLSPELARRLTDRIDLAIGATWLMVVQAWRGRAWEVLGYESWEAYCKAEFTMPTMSPAERQAILPGLHEEGMPTAAIAVVVGTHRTTVTRDLDKAAGPKRVRPTRSRTKILARQRAVAELHHKGLSQPAIAERLGVAQSTVCTDLAAIREFRERAGINVEDIGDPSLVDEHGRTHIQALAERIRLGEVRAQDLAGMAKSVYPDIVRMMERACAEIVFADEWLDPEQRADTVKYLAPCLARLLEAIAKTLTEIGPAERKLVNWAALVNQAKWVAQVATALGPRVKI